MTYSDAIAELEGLLAQLQEVPADVDQLYARIARAESLVAQCRAKLRGIEDELDQLNQTAKE